MKYALTLVAVALATASCSILDSDAPAEITVLTYNVQNLFDDVDDGTEYRDYDPGVGTWTTQQYHRKLASIARVIMSSTPNGPTILALQEVENVAALTALAETYLQEGQYREAVLVPTPGSAVNTAVLSRLPITTVRSHAVSVLGYDHPLRDVLEVWIDLGDSELALFVNHWKSRSGGTEETAPMRRAAARVVRGRVSRLALTHPAVDVLVAGDLNIGLDAATVAAGGYSVALGPAGEAADTSILQFTLDPGTAVAGLEAVVLFSPWDLAAVPGSYVYRESWEAIDHFLLGPGLVDDAGWVFAGFEVVREPFMITNAGAPRRWIDDSGYSDHFPLLLPLAPAGTILNAD